MIRAGNEAGKYGRIPGKRVLWGHGMDMKKEPNESWLYFLGRVIQDLLRDKEDAKYWSGIFGMTGSACLAVAFIEGSSMALYAGIACCLYGLKINRKGKGDAE